MQPADALADVEVRVEQHAVDDEPHEERLDHLQAGADEREREDDGDAVAMRPEPAEVLAEILAPLYHPATAVDVEGWHRPATSGASAGFSPLAAST